MIVESKEAVVDREGLWGVGEGGRDIEELLHASGVREPPPRPPPPPPPAKVAVAAAGESDPGGLDETEVDNVPPLHPS